MLRLARVREGLAIVTAITALLACGDDSAPGGGGTTSSTGGAGGVGGAAGGAGGEGGQGGGEGGVLMCDPGEGVTLALTELYFGEGNSGEWKSVGLNVDGLDSDGASTDVCQPNSGGDPDTAYPDGNDGIDNSFGKNLLPTLLALSPQFSVNVNAALTQGNFNAMLKMYCLPETGDANIITKVFGGTDLESVPMYDGTDLWPVAPEILADPQDPESSTLVFENSSVEGSTFDSGKGETFILAIPIEYNDQTALLKLTLYGAQLKLTLSEDRRSATGGVIGGVLNTEELIDQIKKVGWVADMCEEETFQSILTYVRQVSDIMTDGTQDPDQTCDGISFGVKFEMKEVQLGAVGPESIPGMACP